MLNVLLSLLISVAHAHSLSAERSEATSVREQAFNIALEYELDPYLFIAIIEQESAFKVGAYNPRTKDYGLGQINLKNAKALKLNRKRLLHDPEYNLRAAAQILSYMKLRYAHEREWYCRYNVGVGKLQPYRKHNCQKYARLINKKLQQVLIAQSEQVGGN